MALPPEALLNSRDWRLVYDSEAQKHNSFLLSPSVLISLIRIYVILPLLFGNIVALCARRGVASTSRLFIMGTSKPSRRRSRKNRSLNTCNNTKPNSAIGALYRECARIAFHLSCLLCGHGLLYGRGKEFIRCQGRRVIVTQSFNLILAVVSYYVPAFMVHQFLSDHMSPDSEDPLRLTIRMHVKMLLSAPAFAFGSGMSLWLSSRGGASQGSSNTTTAPAGFDRVKPLLSLGQLTAPQILCAMRGLIGRIVKLLINGTEDTGSLTDLSQRGPRVSHRADPQTVELQRRLRRLEKYERTALVNADDDL